MLRTFSPLSETPARPLFSHGESRGRNICAMRYGTGAERRYALYWSMEKFFMAPSSATPASCISYLGRTASLKVNFRRCKLFYPPLVSTLTSQRWRWCSRQAAGWRWRHSWTPPDRMSPCWRRGASLPREALGEGSAPPPGPAGPVTGPTDCWDTQLQRHTVHAAERNDKEILFRKKTLKMCVGLKPYPNNRKSLIPMRLSR